MILYRYESHTIIIPTYNESENISTLLDQLTVLDVDVLIVDDNSLDNTAEFVKKNQIYITPKYF